MDDHGAAKQSLTALMNPEPTRKIPIVGKILGALAMAVLLFMIVVATRPSAYQVVRSTSINSTPSIPFEEVNNFHNWEAWSPWVKIDPNLQQNYEGPTNGVGAIYTWAGNNKVGAGRMTITDTRTNEFIKIKLEFLKPFPSAADTEFSFKPDNTNTTVSWKMSGNHTFISKAMSLFIGMDQMIGPSFDQGLKHLKSISEAAAKK
jgi:hypothetical protein